MPQSLPPWLTTLLAILVALTAIAVLIADDADPSWQLSSGVSGLLYILAGAVPGWLAPSPHDKAGGT